ncbi:MAG: glutamate--tRNA ligase [Candidatus Margulisiibacteriota bacterium]
MHNTQEKSLNQSVRVRFAPSPTGALHLGGGRTALFNYLFAKHHGGQFILRIEDTDQGRSTEEAVKTILEGLEWLGIYWDEGPKVGGSHEPYCQTGRLNLYHKYAHDLLAAGRAYYCYCTPDELAAARAQAEKEKTAPKYSGRCRTLSPEEEKAHHANKRTRVLRFKTPESGQTGFPDLCRGEVKFENELLDDFIIIKSDGFPTYNFAAVIDDHLMEISHVIRGDDHISNTPRQIQLYLALGWEPPQFGHLPMILGKDKARLSKRHGAKSVTEYEKEGFLPEAMVNFLARLGWGHLDQEIFSREELVKLFTLGKVAKSPAIFDADKLIWLNKHYIAQALPERIFDLCLPYLEKAYPHFKLHEKEPQALLYAEKVIALLKDRLQTIPDIVPLSEYFFNEVEAYEEKARAKYFKGEATVKILNELKTALEATEPFDTANIEKAFKGLAEKLGVKLGEIIHPARLALTGRGESPGIYAVVEVVGKEKTINRIAKTFALVLQ